VGCGKKRDKRGLIKVGSEELLKVSSRGGGKTGTHVTVIDGGKFSPFGRGGGLVSKEKGG